MPRGGMKVKPAKVAQPEVSALSRVSSLPFTASKPTRTNTDWRAGIPTPTFLSRNSSKTKLAAPMPELPPPVQEVPRQPEVIEESEPKAHELPVQPAPIRTNFDFQFDERPEATSSSVPNELESSVPPTPNETPSAQSIGEEATNEAVLGSVEGIEETQSSASSLYSRDSSSIYSRDSASIYSSASSVYSSGASVYSFDECGSIAEGVEGSLSSRVPGQQRARPPLRRQDAQDDAARERSSLAKKAAMFKNSRLPPQLPAFSTSLPAWSMVCRAAHASQDCYDSSINTRRGTYTPADTSKDIKAMIIDEQLIDGSSLVIISIRGTQTRSLADWAANKAANAVKPVGFFDDEENACHAGFLQITKAMVGQVAAQLQQHPASSERPSLLFTGHSAGGAVAAMLYSHMLSTSVSSDLTALASQFPSINCVTFGAPPLSLTPLPRRGHGAGVFLSFANEGDPVLRLSNAAYAKSLAKLMTASAPSSVVAATAPVKVVRRSRGSAVVYRAPAAPPTPWEELPLWPTPAASLTNAGDVILLRDRDNGSAAAARVTVDELSEVIFGDLTQHTIEMYIRRVKEVALSAMTGRM